MKKLKCFRSLGAVILALLLSLAGCGEKEPVQTTAFPETQVLPETSEQEFFETDENSTEDLSEYENHGIISDGTQNGKDPYETDVVPEGQQMPVEPGNVEIDTANAKTCYLSVSCKTILDNMENLEPGKEVLVPADGVIFPKTAVTFYEGESVFDVLQRVTRENRIHMSSRFTPVHNSAYIEGINNLYEFDCGSLSGWCYCVNDWYPNYGVSRYVVQEDDDIQFHYSCDLGRDLPGGNWIG